MVSTRRAAVKSKPDEETKQLNQGKKPQSKNIKDEKSKNLKTVLKAIPAKKEVVNVKSKIKPLQSDKKAKKVENSIEEVVLPTKRSKISPPDTPKLTKKPKIVDSISKQDNAPRRSARAAVKKQSLDPEAPRRSARGAKKQPLDPEDSKPVQKPKNSLSPVPATKKQVKKPDTPSISVAPTPTAPLPQFDQPAKLVEQIKKGNDAVDSKFPLAQTCHFYEEDGLIYTCTLNQTNNNQFYIIQILETDLSPSRYYIWNRWGRVGYDGQNSMSSTSDLKKAIHQFTKKKRDKISRGYIEIELVPKEEETKQEVKTAENLNSQDAKKTDESKLDRRVQNLMSLIFDIKSINRALVDIGYDAKKMPLGKLSQNNIIQGLEILKEIEAVLDHSKTGDVSALTGRFYNLIPHDFGFQHMSKFLINTAAKLKEKVEMLDAISDMKIASTFLAHYDEGNPVDEYYEKLNINLTPLEKDDPVFKLLSDYVKNTHATTHTNFNLTVLDIFRSDKDNSEFRDDIDNHMLLWHGSRLTNWAGILSQGLRMAPPEAPVSGYMFGKGVYFADMVSKSASYCCTRRDNNVGLLLCCEVALGECNEKMQSDYYANLLPAGKSSTKGCGKTAPAVNSYVDLEGCKVPLGIGMPTKVNGSLLYNEYIVYDTAQIKMKFLFKIRFDYK